ncbi:alpha-protein kinase 2-like isoform X1 [Ctenopharyngodon idella]|uniref:alpha-protein kinase 2-like isoform X1 n=1 Tax=Ctenopharyngodon idella TaxID=7959 RepID=UPI002232C562|nr:alpha-protein kinase 2-like isoform X1 [Ctenopharyngodon idella]
MTAERVDNLLLLDTDAVNSSLASVPIKQDEPAHAPDNQTDDSVSPVPDQQPDPASESQGRAMEIHSPNIHGETENESGLVLTHPLDHTALIEQKINHPNADKSNNCDFDTGVVMETDNITNSTDNPDPIHLMDVDNMIDRNQNNKQSDLKTIEDPNEAHGTLMSPEVPSLTEHNRQEEMSQYTILNQYSSSESVGLEVSQMANDDDPLVNTVSDVMNSEKNHEQPFSIANNETDATSPESFIQTCGDTPEGVYVAVEAVTAYNTDPEIHDIAGHLTCAGFTTSQTPKIEDPKTDDPICLADLHKADILTHASTLLDSLGMSNVLETADMPANDSEIIQTVNKDSASSNGEFCTAVFTQTVQNLRQVSEHDVTDLESNRTDDSMLDRMIDTKFSFEVSRVQPLVACSHDTGATIGNNESFSPQSILETPQIGEKHEKDLSQVVPNPTPVTNGDLGKCSEETGGGCLKFTGMERDVKAGSELWLDACQFLAGEEDEGAIFDKWGRSCSPSPLTAHSDNTKASDYSRRENISIDHHAEDLELRFKPVERWSSSDSWASALSDWFQAVNTYPEDLSANTSGSGSKHSMAIQDKILEQRTGPDNANNTGQTCLSLNLLEPEEPGQASSRGQVQSDNTNGTKGDKDGLPSHSDADSRDNTMMENNMSLLETLVKSESLKPDENAAIDTFNGSKSCMSSANEFNPKQYGSQHISVNTYLEDLSANISSSGSKHSMAIQDKILEQRTGPDNANNTGQTCLSLNVLEPEEPGQASSRGQVLSDNTNGTKGDKDGLPSHSDADSRDNTTMENNMSLLETLVKSESLKPDKNAAIDTFNASKSCMSSANEFNPKQYGSQHISGELWSAKSEGNKLVEVTGDKISVLGLVFEEERQSSFSSLKISAYTSNKNLTGCVSGEERRHGSNVNHHTCLSQSDVHVSSEAGCAEGNGSFVHSNSEDCTVKPREEERSTIPGFIMPFAPLCTGNNFLNHSLLREDSPRADLDLSHKGIVDDPSIKDTHRKSEYSDTCDISKELSKLLLLTGEHFMVSEDKRVAYVTLDLEEPRNLSLCSLSNCEELPKTDNMPHKTSKTSSDGKTHSKHKEKLAEKQQHGIQTLKKQDLQFSSQVKDEFNSEGAGCEDCPVTVIETIVITEKTVPKVQVKKKKKLVQHGMSKPENDPPTNIVSRSAQKSTIGKTENLNVKMASNGLDKPAYHLPTKMDITNKDSTQIVMSVRPKVEPSGAKMDPASVNTTQKAVPIKLKADASNTAKMENKTCTSDSPSECLPNMPSDDIKRRRIADVSGAVPIRTRPQLPAIFRQARKDGEDVTRKAYSEVVKQKIPKPKEVVVPCVVSEIQADPVPADPQNILLWCQFSPIPPDATIKWTKEGRVLSEINKVEKDDGRFTLTILEACSKDLGLYKCSLNAANISVSTSEYHLTSEVLMELVIPSHDKPAEPRVMDGDEENIQCSPLLFKEDFLADQYFGENQPASIVTEKVHFGEGMHRKAFRTTLRECNLPRFNPGHPCVLKVHNGISYGIKNNEELVQKNYSLAVEECHVQNTAREYIKAYNSVAKSAESFGEVPEIIPIYLVHRPSNEIPYATLEEELLGDFVKYSVKDGKEINLMRRDSEAGQKCCAFQHWVYTQTEGNLLVTDMQGVGMKLTDVGIATGKKGYKGFKGNCATSFIDQFKALHQCNRYCELLGLTSLQPKPKRTVVPPKPKTQPLTKKKTFGPVLNGKS